MSLLPPGAESESESESAIEGERDSWHRQLHHIVRDALRGDTTQTSGMRRLEAISGKTVGAQRLWMGQTHVAPSTSSGNHHHHGEAETAIFVLSGHPVFVFAEGRTERRVQTAPGDYVFVPPYVAHREENPDVEDEAVVIIARSTQEGIVINLADLWSGGDGDADGPASQGG